MRRSADGVEPPTYQFEVTAKLTTRKRETREDDERGFVGLNHASVEDVVRSNRALTALERDSEEKAEHRFCD